MDLKKIISVTHVKKDLMKILKEVERSGDPCIITRDGFAAGVLMSIDDYEGYLETREIMADKKLLTDIRKALNDLDKGRSYSYDEVFKE